MRSLFRLLGGSLVLVLAWSALAHKPIVGQIQELPAAGRVAITNGSNDTRYFSIRRENSHSWDDHALRATRAEEFPCGASCNLRIRTGDKPPVVRTLEARKRYTIYWDNMREKWDIR